MLFVVVRVLQWRVGMKMNGDGVDLPELVTITLGRNAFRFDSNCCITMERSSCVGIVMTRVAGAQSLLSCFCVSVQELHNDEWLVLAFPFTRRGV